eukprot:TRINITY_DN6323_c0_g1_i11.p1 TRINITY_DN6323_c0_g1~~TRINITY_DN6323_c0_g1_i11.p1  ORF type:complete len:365 (-),score=43.59 TRINITY_DN6323_c0_g1_i11:106-1200(-)
MVPEGVEKKEELCCSGIGIIKRCFVGRTSNCDCKRNYGSNKACRKVESSHFLDTLELVKMPVRSGYKIVTYSDLTPRGVAVYDGAGKFKAGINYVLFLYPTDDPNGAFAYTQLFCSRISCWQDRGYKVVLRRISTNAEGIAVLEKFPDRSLQHVVLGGHGNSEGISWGGAAFDGVLSHGNVILPLGWNTKSFLRLLRQKLQLVGSTVLLDSCSTASKAWFGRNFFEAISGELPGSRVVASEAPVSDSMFKLDRQQAQELGTHCLAGDTIRFVNSDGNQTSASPGSMPKCDEVGSYEMLQLITKGLRCMSNCRTSCEKVMQKLRDEGYSTQFQLEEDVDAEKPHSPCLLGNRRVCRPYLKGLAER